MYALKIHQVKKKEKKDYNYIIAFPQLHHNIQVSKLKGNINKNIFRLLLFACLIGFVYQHSEQIGRDLYIFNKCRGLDMLAHGFLLTFPCNI